MTINSDRSVVLSGIVTGIEAPGLTGTGISIRAKVVATLEIRRSGSVIGSIRG